MSMGGGGGGQTSVTKSEIPAELKPLASAYTTKALDLSQQAYTPFSGQRFAEFTPQQSQALGMIEQRAMSGSPLQSASEGALLQNIQGGQTNPFLDAMVKRAQENVLTQGRQAMVGSGSFGNSGVEQQLTRGLGDVASQMYGQAYETDRARQMQAIGMAPQLQQAGYQDAAQLLQAGQLAQNQQQQAKDFAYQQFQEAQNLPYKQLAAMSGVFGTDLGRTQTTTQSGGGK